jgi:hypothetical protein
VCVYVCVCMCVCVCVCVYVCVCMCVCVCVCVCVTCRCCCHFRSCIHIAPPGLTFLSCAVLLNLFRNAVLCTQYYVLICMEIFYTCSDTTSFLAETPFFCVSNARLDGVEALAHELGRRRGHVRTRGEGPWQKVLVDDAADLVVLEAVAEDEFGADVVRQGVVWRGRQARGDRICRWVRGVLVHDLALAVGIYLGCLCFCLCRRHDCAAMNQG